MSKHTPGPWIAREVSGAGWPGQRGFAIDYNADQEQVVDFVYIEADARLIAAAPDLLAALERLKCEVILSDVDMGYIKTHFQSHLDAAEAAILKARGGW